MNSASALLSGPGDELVLSPLDVSAQTSHVNGFLQLWTPKFGEGNFAFSGENSQEAQRGGKD